MKCYKKSEYIEYTGTNLNEIIIFLDPYVIGTVKYTDNKSFLIYDKFHKTTKHDLDYHPLLVNTVPISCVDMNNRIIIKSIDGVRTMTKERFNLNYDTDK
jgi:hypothetical protein